MKGILYFLLLTLPEYLLAQGAIAHFSVWKPNSQQEHKFEEGYKKHLLWHQANKDPWSWYGWYVLSGPRNGYFVDATFDHSWKDFDNSIKPADDQADNQLHTFPFGDYLTGYKLIALPQLSINTTNGLKSRFLRVITLQVTHIDQGQQVIEKLKAVYSTRPVKTFLVFKAVDGTELNLLTIFIGLESFEEFAQTENIQDDLAGIEDKLKSQIIVSCTSETWVYKPDMSLFPGGKQ
ncbi:hypothetical protein [Xanthocytophaga agilis]|uniref:Antibiotic biosynthesis monooxygenase n=1 Tax=Xanthocytophaga agilis TaxID=3048010 RepID=A0AAE3RB43_9BACT|nr:hypothetical protein [Xanthocytophaga agilis]MDJ1504709.1 hypothetical protein [Xanthocytophaga agilis]